MALKHGEFLTMKFAVRAFKINLTLSFYEVLGPITAASIFVIILYFLKVAIRRIQGQFKLSGCFVFTDPNTPISHLSTFLYQRASPLLSITRHRLSHSYSGVQGTTKNIFKTTSKTIALYGYAH